jgi:hypothetical protein
MKTQHRSVLAFVFAMAMCFPVLAGDEPGGRYVPNLGDIMGAMQLRHFKLWYAGNVGNWRLVDYELRQIKASFLDAMTLYPNIPEANMTTVIQPAEEIRSAIETKDRTKFDQAFEKLTSACNSCHNAVGLDFIEMRVPLTSPLMTSPFSDQSFSPESK